MKIFHRVFALLALVACPDIGGANKEQLPLASCATRIAANGFVNALHVPVASALLDTPKEVTVRQRAILGRDGKLYVFDGVILSASSSLWWRVRNGHEACSFLPEQMVCSAAPWPGIQQPQRVSNQMRPMRSCS
jgi:hypothetical protein